MDVEANGSAAAANGERAAPPKPARAPTPYETRLYAVCKAIPKGKVTTYGAMAAVLGSAPRAVGQVRARALPHLPTTRRRPPPASH